jgi:hypothetical protein
MNKTGTSPNHTPLELNQTILESTGLDKVVPTLAEIVPTRTLVLTVTKELRVAIVNRTVQYRKRRK